MISVRYPDRMTADQYRRELLASGIAIILPTVAGVDSMLEALCLRRDMPDVACAVEYGIFHNGARRLLVLPPNAKTLERVRTHAGIARHLSL